MLDLKELLSMYKQLRDIQDPSGKGNGVNLQINISGVDSGPVEVINND